MAWRGPSATVAVGWGSPAPFPRCLSSSLHLLGIELLVSALVVPPSVAPLFGEELLVLFLLEGGRPLTPLLGLFLHLLLGPFLS